MSRNRERLLVVLMVAAYFAIVWVLGPVR